MSLIDFWDFQPLELKESNKPHVLGVAQGNFFFTDRPSRNKRKYSNEAWESALADENVKRTMKNGNLLGTVGHADVDYDTLIREGKVSHRTTKLVLNKNGTGYGEAEIVDTPVGRVLYNLMKSGSKIAVSSKAVGESKGKDDDVGTKIIYVEQVKANTHPVQCRCDCKDFSFRFGWADKSSKVLSGPNTYAYTRKTLPPPEGYPYANPGNHSGFCKHLFTLIELLQKRKLLI